MYARRVYIRKMFTLWATTFSSNSFQWEFFDRCAAYVYIGFGQNEHIACLLRFKCDPNHFGTILVVWMTMSTNLLTKVFFYWITCRCFSLFLDHFSLEHLMWTRNESRIFMEWLLYMFHLLSKCSILFHQNQIQIQSKRYDLPIFICMHMYV